MSIQSEIDRISTAVQNAHLKVIEKGGTSAAPYLVANLAQAIDTIPEATEPTLQSKSVTPSESAQTVKPDSGYDGLSQVSVGAISKTYVGSSVPKQAAQTITPGTADKTIASGRYLTGTQTIKGDSNLKAENIKSGVSIFGVAGTVEEGEDVTAETETYTGLLTDLEAAIEELPDAGSGSGSGVETCTVTVNCQYCVIQGCFYQKVENGEINYKVEAAGSVVQYTLENVVCGSGFVIHSSVQAPWTTTDGGVEKLGYPYSPSLYCFLAPTEAGANGSITITETI